MRERADAERLRARAVRDRARNEVGRPSDDLAALERVAGVGRELGLDADDPGRGSQRPDRRRDAGGEAAAADRDEDGRHVRQVGNDLEPDRPLPGDDPIVVVWRDDRQAAFGGQPFGGRLALVARGADRDDLGPVGGDPLSLDGRGVRRHHHDRRRAEEASRPGDALGVVARRVGDDAAGTVCLGTARRSRHTRHAA